MSLYERFTSTHEEGFRNEFIKPLLSRMGFVGISNEHGVGEFGKDFVFLELDRFGKLRHMIIQAKHEATINQGKKVDDLLTQIRQAFFVPYTLAVSPTEQRYVSSVYVFNTGKITENAKTQIIHELPKECGANTHFFDGAQLESLDVTTQFQSTRVVRERLVALMNQLGLNCRIWYDLDQGIDVSEKKNSFDVRGSILHGIEQFISEPLLPDRISLNQMVVLWQYARIIGAISQKHYLLPIGEPAKTQDLTMLKEKCKSAIAIAAEIIGTIQEALKTIPT